MFNDLQRRHGWWWRERWPELVTRWGPTWVLLVGAVLCLAFFTWPWS